MKIDESTCYAGFWVRVVAAVIDTILLMILTTPLLYLIYGSASWESEQFFLGFWDVLIGYVLPAVLVMLFWIYKSATPGKMLFKIVVCDGATGRPLSVAQSLIRYAGYVFATIPFGIGIIWVAFSERKRGWHDMMSGSVVVYREPQSILDEFEPEEVA